MRETEKQPGRGKLLAVLGKIALAGCVIAGIGFLFLVIDGPTGEVQTAEADIWDIFASQTTKNEKFVRVLQREGMAQPRSYDHNGNQVFFSYSETRESPEQVMHRFQEAFAAEGVNTIPHQTVREPIEPHREFVDEDDIAQAFVGSKEFFTGGLVPIHLTRNRMAMVGVETAGQARTFAEVFEEAEGGMANPADMMGAFRFLDAEREEGSLKTKITAVWADEGFDLRKFQHGPGAVYEGTVHPIEHTMPLCFGCRRVSRMSGQGREEGMHTFLYRSTQPVWEVVSYYDRHMGSYGWELEPVMRGISRLVQEELVPSEASDFRSFVRGSDHLTLIVYYDYEDGYTYVKKMIMP